MAEYQEDKNLPRIVTLIAAAAALLVAFLLPFVYYLQSRALLLHEISTKASVKAELVGLLATRAPDSWRYQDHRLIELLERVPAEIGADQASVLAQDGSAVVKVGPPLGEPTITVSRPVLDAGVPVGEVRVSRSLRALLANTLALALLGLALGTLVFVALRLLPLRALRAATTSLHAHLRYQEKIAAFGQFALGKQTHQQLIDEAVQHVLQGLRTDAVAYVERAAGDREIVLRAVEGLPHPAGARTARYDDDAPIARVLQTSGTVHIAPAAQTPAPLPFDWAQDVSDALLAPVAGESSVRGALCALARRGEILGDEQARFVESVATVLSAALQRIDTDTRLAHLAQFDSLTGLPNRALLRDRCSQLIERARRRGASLAVLFIDLDGFKSVNDSLGHAAGDDLLCQTGVRLKACVRAEDTVARNAGDEFAVVLADLAKPEDAAIVARKMVERVAAPFDISGREVFVTASVGIAGFPNDGADAEALISAADGAMYRAKQLGRNGYQFFTAEINQRLRVRSQLVTELHQALQRKEFVLHYQPKVDLASGAIRGIEALLRWAHPERGLVSPAEFIPALEETGLIVPVGEWVTREACRQVRAWQQSGLKVPPVAVNLSARQFQHKDLERTIVDILRETGVAPELLQFEITESLLMDDPDAAGRTLRSLKQAGVRLSIDDFGTGYSSLSYLRRFPLDTLKIDRTFIKDMVSNPDDAAITLAVINLAHSLGLRVVAEGVETESQVNLLTLHACDEMQGYHFSRPVAAPALETMLREGRRLVRSEKWALTKPAVLLLDDSPDYLRLLEHALRSEQFEILTATTAEIAFALLASHRVSVVIADQRMPGMSGAEFLGKLRKLHPNALRIAISGAGDAETVADAVNQAGIYKFLSKEWSSERLRREVAEAYRSALPGA